MTAFLCRIMLSLCEVLKKIFFLAFMANENDVADKFITRQVYWTCYH
jgi:hypothetical protein